MFFHFVLLLLFYIVFLFLIFTICNLFALQEKLQNAFLILIYLIAVIFIYASWSAPAMGCSFSHRALLDYLALFSLPFVWTLDYLFIKKRWIVIAIMGII